MNTKDFKTHRPIDPSDPGFIIPGYTIRWINGKVAEVSPGRPWMVFEKEQLGDELKKHILRYLPGAFNYGNTIRRGDLVLAYCPADLAKEYRKELDAKAAEASGRVTPTEFNKKGKRVYDEEITEESLGKDIVERFKKHGG